MQSWRLILAVTLSAVIIVLVSLHPVLALSDSPPDTPGLSPYWSPAVSRWESIIIPYAQHRNLDPDLVAAVIWKESLGRAWERGPVGAVGLMGVMPFEWRPDIEELENPWTNVAWGARALAHTIRDGQGDLYYALAAYNGGWKQTHLRVTRRYAADVLNHYARAVAMRYELPADGTWVAIFAIEGAPGPNTITVIGPQRPLARYTERPWVQADIPSVPDGVPPHTIVITFVNEQGVECRVNVWLVAENGSPLMPYAETTFSPSLAGSGGSEQHTIPISPPTATPGAMPVQPPVPMGTPTPASAITAVVLDSGADLRPGTDTWWHPSQTLPAGTNLVLSGHDPNFSDWVCVRTVDGASTGWVQIADLRINHELSGLPRVTPIPILTPTPNLPSPTPVLTPTQPAECEGGPLQLNAWHLERACAPGGGWTATIFVGGRGGDCLYTYAWEGEVKGGPMSGPMTFEIYQVDRFAPIIGTALVTSTGETVGVGLFIKPPFGDDE
jgi:hypothetical protein